MCLNIESVAWHKDLYCWIIITESNRKVSTTPRQQKLTFHDHYNCSRLQRSQTEIFVYVSTVDALLLYILVQCNKSNCIRLWIFFSIFVNLYLGLMLYLLRHYSHVFFILFKFQEQRLKFDDVWENRLPSCTVDLDKKAEDKLHDVHCRIKANQIKAAR